MKRLTKIFATILMTLFCFGPVAINAKVVETDFKETVDAEISVYGDQEGYESAIEAMKAIDFTKHEDAENKVNVYIFRGSTCGYCFKAVNYFASQYEEYGEYFDLKTYEVWGNSDNSELLEEVANKLGVDEVSGVPFIVIGDQYWEGFSESLGDEMIAQIMDEYNSNSRTDILEEINNPETDSSDVAVIVTVSVLAAVIIGLLVVAKIKTK